MRKNKRQNKRVRNNNLPPVPPPDTIAYKGPIPSNTAESGIVATLRDVATLGTGAGTSFLSLLDNNPSSADNWSEYSTSWNEYRVLGIKFHYVPGLVVNTTAVSVGPMVHAIVHTQSAPSPTTLAEALSYGDAKLGHTTKEFTAEWRMTASGESDFGSTTSPGSTSYAMITYADGLTTAINYGVIFRTWLIQFRNSRK